MKKSFLILLVILGFQLSYGQEQVALSKKNAIEEYCMVLATSKLLSTKLTIQVDFGQEWSFWKDKRSMKDEGGKKLEFNSVIDAFNYMAAQGWEYVNAYAITVGNQNVYHYVLKRKLTEEEKSSE